MNKICLYVYRTIGSKVEEIMRFGYTNTWKVMDNLSMVIRLSDESIDP